jgi:hypothetical protein
MKKNNILFFIIGGVLILGILFLIINFLSQDKKFIWTDNLRHEQGEPYDLALFHEILKSNFKVEDFKEEKLKKDIESGADFSKKGYLFIGEYPHHDSESATMLYNFVRKGGTVFIISNFAPDTLFKELSKEEHLKKLSEYYYNHAAESYFKSSINCKLSLSAFEKNNYEFEFKKSVKDTATYGWAVIPDYMIDSKQSVIGRFYDQSTGSHTNFIRFNVGKGKIFWHRNPILFSNYYLSANNENQSGFNYLNDVLTIVNVYEWSWDKAEYNADKQNKPTKKFNKPRSPMEFIFNHKSLTWAWIMTLLMSGLYLIFGAKRKQNSIAVIETNRNTSLEFINTIGTLYFQQQNHKIIFERIMQLFRAHLKRRYGIIVKEDSDDSELLKQIVLKTAVDAEIVNAIFSTYFNLKKKLRDSENELSSESLNKFHLLLDKFYKAEKNRKKSKPLLK